MPSGFRFPDPNVVTRKEYSEALLTAPIGGANANREWAKSVDFLKQLYRLLLEHPAMDENREQVFMVPAIYKNKVYFMWDFVGRTLGMMLMLDPTRPQEDHPGVWGDASGRTQKVKELIAGDSSGALDLMCPDDRGQKVEFGKEIEELVAA